MGRDRLIVNVGEIDNCNFCSACQITDIRTSPTRPNKWKEICAIAKLENKLGKPPTLGELENSGVHTNKIPENCVNEYLNPKLMTIAKKG